MKTLATKLKDKIVAYLSHRPKIYALIVGAGIVLFWRGVWHGYDHLMMLVGSWGQNNPTIDAAMSPWWDWGSSLILGIFVLNITGAFISSFIGNELILSGLRGEKKLNQKTESEIKTEVRAVSDIQDILGSLSIQVGELEKKVRTHHHES
jgi:hypothetical protein